MSIFGGKFLGNNSRRGWVGGLAAGGLVAVVWLFVAHAESDDNLASEAGLRAAADSAGRILSSDGQVLHSLNEAIEFARARREKLRTVSDYTAIFSKTELVNERLISQTMDLKFRQQPFSVYVHGHSKRQPAREVIFVAGMNDDKLTLHEAGLKSLITIHLKPDDPRVMAENKYPITEIGMAKMLDAALVIWEREKDIAPTNVEVLLSNSTRFGSVECEEIQITHKQRLGGLKFHITRVAFEIKSGFPVLLEQYDWPRQAGEAPPLVEQYLYSDVKTNSGLTDADFDPENSEYKFGFASLP
ncbi:MAG: DUF1571 domain-containing protein [Planctomycetia bacterium]|nr:DUF1571 domain-containing protein [Planctomycetia bacterium]